MATRPEKIIVGARWGERKQSASDVMGLIFQLLSRLRSISPLFDRFETMKKGDKRATLIPLERAEFDQFVPRFLEEDEVYDNPDPLDKRFTLDSTSEMGFSAWFLTRDDETGLCVTVRSGAYGPYSSPCVATIEIPPVHQPAFTQSDMMRALILILIEVFSPERVRAYTHDLMEVLDPERKFKHFGVWMHIPGANIPNLPAPLSEVEFGVAGGTLVHFNVPLPWSNQAKKLRPAFEAFRDAGLLTPR